MKRFMNFGCTVLPGTGQSRRRELRKNPRRFQGLLLLGVLPGRLRMVELSAVRMAAKECRTKTGRMLTIGGILFFYQAPEKFLAVGKASGGANGGVWQFEVLIHGRILPAWYIFASKNM